MSEPLEHDHPLLGNSWADPSTLSSTGIPVWVIGGFANYNYETKDVVQGDLCYHTEAIRLLIELGMSVKQELPLGRTAFHYMAGRHNIINVEINLQLLLEKE